MNCIIMHSMLFSGRDDDLETYHNNSQITFTTYFMLTVDLVSFQPSILNKNLI